MLFFPNRQGYLEPEAIFEWYQMCAAAIDSHRAAFLNWLSNGATGVPPSPLSSALIGGTREDVVEHFDQVAKELELSSVLWLVTACEGRLRVDLRTRLKDQDFLATRLQIARNGRAQEFLVPLEDEGIFDAWKAFIRGHVTGPLQDQAVNAMGSVKPLIDLRHWLARGRYWQTKVSTTAQTPAAVRNAVIQLFRLLDQCAAKAGIRAVA
ncbi:hypothetical protein EJP67_11735 [Variovorax guangxiensis]|uniref:Uncharacterized protein n=1 Tax=Variovorax guangxiensis TaxID=1775474 RepID=A0A433MJ57_9BURK|nr:hypothetical protein [Variovorax guangxiensis]RUR67725.1 hypothetical protein EJP67_11735 [Variovorax guangxiensis]